MTYVGKGPGPLWVRAIYSGATFLAVGVLLAGEFAWRPSLPGEQGSVLIGMGLVLSVVGVVMILYGFRWHRRGIDDAALGQAGQQVADKIAAMVRKEEAPPRTKAP